MICKAKRSSQGTNSRNNRQLSLNKASSEPLVSPFAFPSPGVAHVLQLVIMQV